MKLSSQLYTRYTLRLSDKDGYTEDEVVCDTGTNPLYHIQYRGSPSEVDVSTEVSGVESRSPGQISEVDKVC